MLAPFHVFRHPGLQAVLLLLAWAAGSLETVRWWAYRLAAPEHTAQGAFLLGASGALLATAWTPHTPARPRVHQVAAVGLAALLVCLARTQSDVHTLHALSALLLLATAWNALFPARPGEHRWALWLLLPLALPIQSHLDAHLGVPLRLGTANTVAQILAAAGQHGHRVDTVLRLDHGVTDVALACSGVRTLGFVAFLWLLMTWRARNAPAWRVLGAGACGAVIAVVFNGARVLAMAWWGPAHQLHPLGPVIHDWLGLVTLLAAALAMHAALGRTSVPTPRPSARQALPMTSPARGEVFPVTTLWALCLLPALVQPHASTPAAAMHPPHLANIACTPLPWTHAEHLLVQNNDGATLHKQRCQQGNTTFQWVVVTAPGVRAQHAPEACLSAAGHQVTRAHTVAETWRLLELDGGAHHALTWFQNAQQAVPDLAARAWRGWLHPAQPWALVTVVPEQPMTVSSLAELQHLLQAAVHPLVLGEP